MFNIGDYMICGANGVCEVEKIGALEERGLSEERMYYTLRPVYANESTVCTPVDNEKIIMRPILSKEEAWELIECVPDIEIFWIEDDKKREAIYKAALRSCNCKELVKIIKTSYFNQKARLAAGKKVTMGDKKYCQMAEEHLYAELALSLEMDKDKVKKLIIKKLENITTGYAR